MINNKEFKLLSDFFFKKTGLVMEQRKSSILEIKLAPVLLELGCETFMDFYLKIKFNNNRELMNKIIDAITTNETMWFRDSHPFLILAEVIFPEYLKEIIEERKKEINIWSVACSSGQEPYSIAITLLEFLEHKPKIAPKLFKIYATDISKAILDKAEKGVYDSFSMTRGMKNSFKKKYFDQIGQNFKIKQEVKNFITFSQLNLQDSIGHFKNMDLVFCRNVLIYFSDNMKKEIYKKISKILNPQGILILGGTETVIGKSDDFKGFRKCNGYYFKKI